MKKFDNLDLFYELLHSETEDEIIAILKKYSIWDDLSVWKPYGDISNNRGIVGNQQSHPVAALVEKIVNSIDAVLLAHCYKNGIMPRSKDAPKSMNEAVRQFFHVHEGLIQNMDARGRTKLAENISLVVSGAKDKPNYIVIDSGEGQCPKDFPGTFLSLLRENKTGIEFVQGKFNMGGTGVLQFSGRNSFQLIISKRNSNIAYPNSDGQNELWGFTLIRRLEPQEDTPQSTYVYLAPDSNVLSFKADSIKVKPGSYPKAYDEPLCFGTLIKIWNYKVPGRLKSTITLDMRNELEEFLQDPALPIRIFERRPGYRAHSFETTVSGLCSVLSDNKEDIEPGFDTGNPLHIPDVGTVSIRFVVIKENDKENKRYPSGIFFNVNGQLHSNEGADFIERRTKLSYIAKSMVVIVDCTKLPQRVREDLFLASRDRMRHCDERDQLYSSIVDYLKEHPGLKELNAQRRQKRIESSISEEETAVIIQQLVRQDPTLAELFGKGQSVKIPKGNIPDKEPFIGKSFPTYFRIKNEPHDGLVRKCPKNKACRVTFETDAVNDYFSRSKDRGHFEISGLPSLKSMNLWKGAATFSFGLPDNVSIGDNLSIQVKVWDISRVEPFIATFKIIVEQDITAPDGTPPVPKGVLFTGLPHIVEVKQESWGTYGFNEFSALLLKETESEGGSDLDIFLNIDNIYLKNEKEKRRDLEPKILDYWFKWGLCLQALGVLYRFRSDKKVKKDEDTNDNDGSTKCLESISEFSRGMAVTIIPVIVQLGQKKLEP